MNKYGNWTVFFFKEKRTLKHLKIVRSYYIALFNVVALFDLYFLILTLFNRVLSIVALFDVAICEESLFVVALFNVEFDPFT